MESGSSSLVVVCSLLAVVAALVVEHGLYGTQASAAVAGGLGSTGLSSCGAGGLVALGHVGSSWIKDQTLVSYIGRWILYH